MGLVLKSGEYFLEWLYMVNGARTVRFESFCAGKKWEKRKKNKVIPRDLRPAQEKRKKEKRRKEEKVKSTS